MENGLRRIIIFQSMLRSIAVGWALASRRVAVVGKASRSMYSASNHNLTTSTKPLEVEPAGCYRNAQDDYQDIPDENMSSGHKRVNVSKTKNNMSKSRNNAGRISMTLFSLKDSQ